MIGALLDTEADYSISSGKMATLLKEVITPWHGSQISTAGGHVVTPLGSCTSRVRICRCTLVVSCLVLRDCSRDVILGVDFLQMFDAIIDQERHVAFSIDRAIDGQDDQQRAEILCVSAEILTLPL